MGSNPFLIKLKTRVFSFFLRFSPFFSLFQSAPPGEGAMLPNHARYQLRYTPEMI